MKTDFLEWVQKITDDLVSKNNKYMYKIRVDLELNPLNYDGMDEITIEIHQRQNRTHAPFSIIVSAHECSLNECIKEINEKLKAP